MEIVTIIENTSRDPSLVAAHGLSLYIEVQGHSLLFDMGPSDAFPLSPCSMVGCRNPRATNSCWKKPETDSLRIPLLMS